MDKNIEIEIRGPLSKEKFNDLMSFFNKEGKVLPEKNRILIDYSTFLEGGVENRNKDIRLRITNGVPEIIIKIGKWGGTDQRKELSVLTNPNSFDTLVEIFAELGLKKGMLCVRRSKIYEYQGIEFAMVEVPNHSYYYEAEKMAHGDEDSGQITEEIERVCRNLQLEIFDKKTFFKYIELLNKEANEVFDYTTTFRPNYFKNRFGL